MNKTAIKNFAVWARNKLIADISYRAGLMGITESGIASALSQSTGTTEFYDIGTAEPYAISGNAVRQRRRLVELIERKAKETDYKTAYKYIVEEVAYTWFNRLIAIRFMEVNDYLPSHIRVLSSESGKMEPDMVTNPYDTGFEFSCEEEEMVLHFKRDNKLDELFRVLFIKQCNELNEILPELFEKTNDYTELLLNISFVDQDGIVNHLVNDIPEDDFNVECGGQVEIIGWLYQYYNSEPKDEAFALLKKNVKLSKERIPAATQLFTPDWIVRYMVENSLGHMWLEGHPNEELKAEWKYYVEVTTQDNKQSEKAKQIKEQYTFLNPEDIKIIDPCMGSGHILVYVFDVLMRIYETVGYSQREAAKAILENNIYGLDIDDRAYQMAYFAVMMKARKYNRRILNAGIECNIYSISESNNINRKQLNYFGSHLCEEDRRKALQQINYLLDCFVDAKEYGSILDIEVCDWNLLEEFICDYENLGQITFDTIGLAECGIAMKKILKLGQLMSQRYHIVVTNPPYMGASGFGNKLSQYVKDYFPDSKSDMFAVFIEKCSQMIIENGFQAMITQPSFLFLASFEKLRNKLLNTMNIESLLHMGRGIFGIDFGSTSFVIRKSKLETCRGCYFRLHERTFQYIDPDDIEKLFLVSKGNFDFNFDFSNYETQCTEIVSSNTEKSLQVYFETMQRQFLRIPGVPIAYWLTENFMAAFEKGISIDDISDFTGSQHKTADNEKYLRLHWEVTKQDLAEKKWIGYIKGGDFRKWYGNIDYVVDWTDRAKQFYVKNKTSNMIKEKYWYKEGITYTSLTSVTNSFRFLPACGVFDIKGPSIIDVKHLHYCLGFLNTKVAAEYLKVLNPTITLQVKDVKNLPLIIEENEENAIREKVLVCIEKAKKDWDSFETSIDFERHPLVNGESTIKNAYEKWVRECDERFYSVKQMETELNDIFIRIYGLKSEISSLVTDDEVSIYRSILQDDIKSFLSYAVGCMFGRYSLDCLGVAYAGGSWNSELYKTYLPDKDNVIPITDEEYLEDDIVKRLCDLLKLIYGNDTLEENLDFIANALGGKGDSSRSIIRNYFLNDFYKDHANMYSITGSGKRPIYWLFESGKQNGFKGLIYMHRYNADTIGNLRVDYLHRIQRVYESEVNRMQDMIDHSTNAREVVAATKRKEKLQKQLKECREYDEKIGHLALSRIDIDLDDGVKVNYEKVQTASDGKKYQVLAKI